MSGICGYWGRGEPAWIESMLTAIGYRGDAQAASIGDGFGLGLRFHHGRPGKAQALYVAPDGVHVAAAGSLAPRADNPAEALDAAIRGEDFAALDGAFALARCDPNAGELTLLRDPFGVRSLYYAELRPNVWVFASELKQLLAIDEMPAELDTEAIHRYLTFSFVPGDSVPVRGVKRLLPGQRLRLRRTGAPEIDAWFTLREEVDTALADPRRAVRELRRLGRAAVQKRLTGEARQGLYLSGGLDSSAVAFWLKRNRADVTAFSLDFGPRSVEREQARTVAEHLEIPLIWVPVSGRDVLDVLRELVWKLDLPFGDAVTGPQFLLARAAAKEGLDVVWNGEGGDQFFGGWTSKPMVAAAVYAGLFEDEAPEAQYLRSYHRFYGLEDALYTPEFRARIGGPGQRRALIAPYLGGERAAGFLNRVRLTDVALKGSQNILPRAERVANGVGLDVRVPLFDRALAEFSFRLPPELKLRGACEKYALKLALQKRLPREVVWRRKFGMSVPTTDWVLGDDAPLAPALDELLSPAALRGRGLFRADYVARLREGRDSPLETRRRRIGEKLWALVMLEQWLRIFIDGRGRAP